MNLLGYNITTDYPTISSTDKMVINTINPHSYCVAKQDINFNSALRDSDVLLPDGIGIVWAAKVLLGRKIQKIAGYDIFLYLMKYLNETNGSCFFLGASDETLTLIKERAGKEFPNVIVSSYSPPYKQLFTEEDSLLMHNHVNNFDPKVLFVGMTAPKQEKWVHENKDKLNTNVVCSIGAVFDFYAGTVKRPSEFWIKLGLEWLPRFLKDPKRLLKRNLISTPKFILEVFSFKIFTRGFLLEKQ